MANHRYTTSLILYQGIITQKVVNIKNYEHSINSALTEKLRPLHKTSFLSSGSLYGEKWKITLLGLWLSIKVLFEEILKRYPIFDIVYCHGIKWTYH